MLGAGAGPKPALAEAGGGGGTGAPLGGTGAEGFAPAGLFSGGEGFDIALIDGAGPKPAALGPPAVIVAVH